MNGYDSAKWMRDLHPNTLTTVAPADFAAEIFRRDNYPPSTAFVRLKDLVGAGHLNGGAPLNSRWPFRLRPDPLLKGVWRMKAILPKSHE